MTSDGSNGNDSNEPANGSDDAGGRHSTPPPLRPNTPPPLRPNTPPPLRPNSPPPLRPNAGSTPPPEPPAPEEPSTESPSTGSPSTPDEQAASVEPPAWEPPAEFDLPSTYPPPAPFNEPPSNEPPAAGRIIRQEPGVTAPRRPTVAESRARDKARKQQAEFAHAQAEAAAKRKKRNRRLIGGGAVVGVVGVVALGYYALKSDEVTAQCTRIQNGEEIVVEDKYCSGSPNSSGIFILAGSQYRYYYGGTGSIGQRPSGGTTVAPKGAKIATKTGTTVQRGGLGSKIGGSGGS